MQLNKSRLSIGLLGVLAVLSVGFVFGLYTDGWAQQESGYDGPRPPEERPEEALSTAKSLERAFQYAANKVQPAVVTVYTKKEVSVPGFPFEFGPDSPFGFPFEDAPRRKREVTGLGSGMIIRSNGYILTNYHVVKDVEDVSVMLFNQQQVDASVVGTDPLTDLAVIKIERTNLPTVEFADSEKVNVGQLAIAVGSPFSLRNTVSYGHVSALHRSVQATQYEDFIQTDAPINRGNSGGPLVNIEGEVIGVNTLIQSTSGGSQGIGFANSSNMAKRVAGDLIDHGHVKRPWIGVSIQRLSSDALREHFDESNGVIVSQVVEGSPAEEAGLKQGDLIIRLNDEPIQSPHDLQRRTVSHEIGEEVRLLVKRDGERMTVRVTLGERPQQEEMARQSPSTEDGQGVLPRLGLALTQLSPAEAERFGMELNEPVLLVRAVKPGSIAQRVGLRKNDMLVKIDGKRITEVGRLEEYLSERIESGATSALMLIKRGERSLFVNVPLPDSGS